ncbi:MAG: hypothetical protein KC910_02715 [Candidatus Eremiobacteraeota bacterium]|nr:hypothetical protein [Candidatus Eremiobacteraeota bacterium]
MKKLLLILLIAFAPALAQGQSGIAPVTGGDAPPPPRMDSSINAPAAANIQAAADFLESMGETETARTIRTRLANGDISVGSVDDGNAETGITGHTTIDRTWISTSRNWDPNNNGQWSNIVSLSRILFHEMIHTRQSSWRHYSSHSSQTLGGENSMEMEAWHATFVEMQDWVDRLKRDVKNASNGAQREKAREHLKFVLGMYRDTIRDYRANGYEENTDYLEDLRNLLDRQYREVEAQLNSTTTSQVQRGTYGSQGGRDQTRFGVFHDSVNVSLGENACPNH